MAITYTKVKMVEVKTEETVTIPDHFGMFTAAGNRAIRLIAEKLYNKIEEMHKQGKANSFAADKAYVDFFVSFFKIQNRKNMSEAYDTAVRDSVFFFADELYKATVPGAAWDTMESNWAEADRKIAEIRRKKKEVKA